LSGRGLCDELITRPEESYRLCCVVVYDLETSRMGAPYIYDISHLRVNVNVRRVYSKRKLGQRYQVQLKRLSKELLAAKKTAHETFFRSVLRNEGNCWSEFYKYVKKRKGNREIIPAIKDRNRTIIMGTNERANILNSYFPSIFCCVYNIPEIKLVNSCETFIINTKVIRKRLAKIGRNKSVGPDGIPIEILKLCGEAMTPYIARLFEISLNNATIPGDRKIATVVPIYKGGDRLTVSNYRLITLTSVVCKQLNTL